MHQRPHLPAKLNILNSITCEHIVGLCMGCLLNWKQRCWMQSSLLEVILTCRLVVQLSCLKNSADVVVLFMVWETAHLDQCGVLEGSWI